MNMKQRLKDLMQSMADGNEHYKKLMDKMNGEIPETYAKLKPTPRTTTTPGYASRFHKAVANIKRRNTKPLMAGWAHGSGMTGKIGSKPAPTLDQVRDLERRIIHKIHVRGGKCYMAAMGIESRIEVPLDADADFIMTMFYGQVPTHSMIP